MDKQDCSDKLSKILPSGPKLETLFETQKRFAAKVLEQRGLDLSYLNTNQQDDFSREFLEAIVQECCELREELRWKSWKKYPKNFKHDVENIRFEIADIMCFLMDLALVWGMDADMFYQYVNSKQMLNFKRQEDPELGYLND